jgi:hypothetical protein
MAAFREGWASKAPRASAHYFRRVGAGIARSLCGAQDAAAGWLMEPGDFKRCARCTRLLAREASKSIASTPEPGQDERGKPRTCDGKGGD